GGAGPCLRECELGREPPHGSRPTSPGASALGVLQGPRGPGGLVGSERWDQGVRTIADLARVRAGVVAAVEDRLEGERHRWGTGQEGDGDRWQAVLETDRVDEERLEVVEAVNRDVVIERPTLGENSVQGHRRRVLAAAEEIDLDQVDLAREDLLLLA